MLNHLKRLPSEEPRVKRLNSDLQVYLDDETKKIFVRRFGVTIFVFSRAEFNSSYAYKKLQEHFYKWKHGVYQSELKALEDGEEEYSRKQDQHRHDISVEAAKEIVKYGVMGSQAPGASSIVVS
jgi:hypothetical protein